MSTQASSPIGVFDSGIGGLTVVRALMERLPFEDIIYFGDTARVPYGVKSVDTIQTFTRQIAEFLLAKDVKLLIIACNTMAAVAVEAVRQLSPVPVLDVIDAGARAAVQYGRKGVGVIGTPTTINSNAYARSIHALNPDLRVYSQACPLFVPLVEEGWLDHEVTRLTGNEWRVIDGSRFPDPCIGLGIDGRRRHGAKGREREAAGDRELGGCGHIGKDEAVNFRVIRRDASQGARKPARIAGPEVREHHRHLMREDPVAEWTIEVRELDTLGRSGKSDPIDVIITRVPLLKCSGRGGSPDPADVCGAVMIKKHVYINPCLRVLSGSIAMG